MAITMKITIEYAALHVWREGLQGYTLCGERYHFFGGQTPGEEGNARVRQFI